MFSRSIDSRRLASSDTSAPLDARSASREPQEPKAAGAKRQPQDDRQILNEFVESSVQGLLDWCSAYCEALNQLNPKVAERMPVVLDEVYFRAAVAINRDLLGFLMGKEVSMIQNAVGVVASMTRARIFEAEPSLLAYLEQAHDMLKRLDPLLWREFSDVVRYVLPLRVRMMEVGVDQVHEVAGILSRERLALDIQDIYPLGYEQVGTVMAMLTQESSAAL